MSDNGKGKYERHLGRDPTLKYRGYPVFRSTGERFSKLRPATERTMIKLLAAGMPLTIIQGRLKVGFETIQQVMIKKRAEIEEEKKVLGAICFAGGRLGMEKAIENLPNEKSAVAAATAGGILLTKAMELTGQSQPFVQINTQINLVAELSDLMKEAKAKVAEVREAKVIENDV